MLQYDFSTKLVSRAAAASAQRITSLGHKISLDTVECKPIVKPALHQIDKISNRGRRCTGIELDSNFTLGCVDDGDQALGKTGICRRGDDDHHG